LFLYGARSDYIHGRYLPAIRALFPFARLRAVAGAGHWLYAEQPDTVASALQGFLQT
jgi:pimeloyl-ACP methyl ester carboxylesterase